MFDRIVTYVESGTEKYPAVIRDGVPGQNCDLTVFGGYVGEGEKKKRVAVREIDDVAFERGNGGSLFPYWEHCRP